MHAAEQQLSAAVGRGGDTEKQWNETDQGGGDCPSLFNLQRGGEVCRNAGVLRKV